MMSEPSKPSQPLVSCLIPTYNQEATVEEALRSALAQTYPALEIFVSDDGSSDQTWPILQSIERDYAGPHRLVVRRNERNLGIARHAALLFALSQGEFVCGIGGDDVALPQWVSTLVSAWQAHDCQPDLVAAPVIDMDATGQCHGVLAVSDLSTYRSADDWADNPPFIIGAGLAYSGRIIKQHANDFPEGLNHEDQLGVLRGIMGRGGITLAEPLVKYRRGGISRKLSLHTGEALRRKVLFDARNDWLYLSQVLKEAGDVLSDRHVQRMQKLIRRARYILDLEAADLGTLLAMTWHHPQVDAGFRIRSLVQLKCPGLPAAVNRLKNK